MARAMPLMNTPRMKKYGSMPNIMPPRAWAVDWSRLATTSGRSSSVTAARDHAHRRRLLAVGFSIVRRRATAAGIALRLVVDSSTWAGSPLRQASA